NLCKLNAVQLIFVVRCTAFNFYNYIGQVAGKMPAPQDLAILGLSNLGGQVAGKMPAPQDLAILGLCNLGA
ncbi:MAG: hypothetical protein ACKPB9_33325, partial [Dolichospermum sp.]